MTDTPRVVLGLLGAVLLTQSFIDLELSASLGGWVANAPLADLGALGLLGAAVLCRTVGPWKNLPGVRGYGAFALVALASAGVSFAPGDAVHAWLRRIVVPFAACGVGVAAWARAPALRPRLCQLLVLWMATTAAVSLGSSLARVAGGNALWFSALEGLTPNHKTLAVSLAGGLPLVLFQRDGRRSVDAVLGLALVAIALSLSKTAWITAALALALFFPQGRPLARRPGRTAPLVLLAMVAALLAPVVLGSRAMLDAARSRHSLNKRAVAMVLDRPVLGQGPGTNVLVEQVTFPDYRVNGVDAHGVLQKVASETGLLGLGTYGWFWVGTTGLLVRRWRAAGARYEGASWGALATHATLTSNLLLSTEAFSCTHWVPFGVAVGLSAAVRPARGTP